MTGQKQRRNAFLPNGQKQRPNGHYAARFCAKDAAFLRIRLLKMGAKKDPLQNGEGLKRGLMIQFCRVVRLSPHPPAG
ncbi:MAG: hypothetical protein ILO43_07715, partial [Clostridia bacterium]|nr:hypothetical protein [Clostridia bacterium]